MFGVGQRIAGPTGDGVRPRIGVNVPSSNLGPTDGNARAERIGDIALSNRGGPDGTDLWVYGRLLAPLARMVGACDGQPFFRTSPSRSATDGADATSLGHGSACRESMRSTGGGEPVDDGGHSPMFAAGDALRMDWWEGTRSNGSGGRRRFVRSVAAKLGDGGVRLVEDDEGTCALDNCDVDWILSGGTTHAKSRGG